MEKVMSQIKSFLSIGVAALIFSSGALCAEYTVVLKNGRRIMVQGYREEGKIIKLYGLGGEIGIAKDQVQSILKSEGREAGEMVLGADEKGGISSGPAGEAEEKREGPPESREKALTPEEERAKEEKEYQKRLREITEQIRTARERYSLVTQGTGNPEAGLTPEGGIQGWLTDLGSRIKESQKSPVSEYTPQEKELRELRNQIEQLEKERESLLGEMKQKGFEPAPY